MTAPLNQAPLNGVAVVLNSYFGPFMMKLARILKERHASTLHLYCKSDVEVDHYRRGPDRELFADISNYMRFYPALRETGLDEAAELTAARDRERRFGITYNALSVSNRHVGRGYALGGFHHPRSHYAEASYLQMVHAYNVQLGFWEREFAENRTTLVLADNKEIAVVAHGLGIPYRTLARARYENLHYWEEAEYREAAPTRRAFERQAKTTDGMQNSGVALPPYTAGKAMINRAMKRARLSTLARQAGAHVARNVYWRLKAYEKAKGYYLSHELRLLLRQRQDIRRMTGSETIGLDQLRGTPYVFYPLHTEPEQALGQVSPEFFFQLEAIAALARDLPVGIRLAVKEVPNACGRRPDNFYDQIMQLKNVVMVNLSVSGQDIIRDALGVATIAGTAGLEAALLGKPVISFGRHNPYNFLDHVFVVHDLAQLRPYLQRMVEGRVDAGQAAADAARYLAAMREVSFDMGNFDYITLERFSADAPLAAYHKLLAGLPAAVPEERRPESVRAAQGAIVR